MARTSAARWLLLLLTALVAPALTGASEISIAGRALVPGGRPFADSEIVLLRAIDPVRRAQIDLAGAAPEAVARARTDSQGYFELSAPGAAPYTVRIAAAGFVPVEYRIAPLLEPTDLPDVALVPDTGLVVRAAGRDGAPIEGAIVRVAPPARRNRASVAEGWGPAPRLARTGADGAVRLPRGEEERLDVAIAAQKRIPELRRAVRGSSIAFRLEAAVERAVEVRSADGSTVEGALVETAETGQPVVWTDPAGIARVPLAKGGSLRVRVTAADGRTAEGSVVASAKPTDPPRRFTLPRVVTLAGRVLDADTRKAIAGAWVWRSREPWTGAPTDGSGRYALLSLDGRDVTVEAGATGYLAAEPLAARADAAEPAGPAIALRGAASVEGIVVDSGGKPVAGARVTLEPRRAEGVVMIRLGAGPAGPAATSSSRGRFRLGPIDPDASYELTARATGFAPAKREIVGLVPRRTQGGLRIELSRGSVVEGRTVDAEGRAIAGVEVEAVPARRSGGPGGMVVLGGPPEEPLGKTISDSDGRFRAQGLPSGTFDLSLRRSGFARKNVPGIVVATGAGPVDLGDVALLPGAPVEGVVVDPSGIAVEGVEISARREDSSTQLVFAAAALGAGAAAPDAITGPDGWFRLDDLAPGEAVQLSLSRRGFTPARESVSPATGALPLRVVMHPASRLTGVVLDPDRKPIAGAGVTLRRSKSGGIGGNVMMMLSQEGTTADDAGRFVFDDLEPGFVALSARAPGWREAKIDALEIPKGEDVEGIELPLAPGATITGRVLAPDGRPAIGAEVREVEEQSPMARFRAPVTDGDGRFRLDGLEPGPLSIEATHPDHVRVVRDLEARPGPNGIELQLGGGSAVSGVVVDSAGSPIAGAWLRLETGGRRFFGAPEGTSGADGSFEIPGTTDGEYTLRAGKDGYAAATHPGVVRVEGAPVRDLRVRLDAGGAVTGRVAGLDPEQIPRVTIRAIREGEWNDLGGTSPDREGRYRLDHLSPGPWAVVATLETTGERARRDVTLAPGVPETQVDLEFAKGLVLSGRVVHAEVPVAGAQVFVEGENVEHSGWSRTDAGGSFTIRGLVAGSYRLELRQWESGLGYSERFEITSDREIVVDVPAARIEGTILDAADRRPIAGATVVLEPATAPARPRFDERAATTGLDGRFRISDVPDGEWKLSASKKGYSARTTPVGIRSGRGPDDVRLELDPTEGLTLVVRSPEGSFPAEVAVAILDAGGSALTRGTFATGEGGRVRLSTVPPGSWEVLVAADGSGTATVRGTVPGPPTTVALPSPCSLRVRIPALGASPLPARVTLEGPDGRPFRSLGWHGEPVSEWRAPRGEAEIGSVPPGSWTVRARTPDGRSWERRATTAAGSPASIVLE